MNTELLNQQTKESLHFFESELFKDVQMSGLFADSKTFTDAIPKTAFMEILQKYKIEKKHKSSFNLEAFITECFDIVEHKEIRSENVKTTIAEHIDSLWTALKKEADPNAVGSLLPLKNPYIVPGGRFREIYYWDSYFTALGLIESGNIALAESMLSNFLELQSNYGCIPNGNRSYYLSRSQPPILGLLVELLLPFQQNKQQFITTHIKAIETEYKFWMQGKALETDEQFESRRIIKMPDGSFLNRYWDDNAAPRAESYREDIELCQELMPEDPESFYRNIRAACESGWDFSSRWLGDENSLASIRTTRILPVDLNCLLYKQEELLAKFYEILGNEASSLVYKDYAATRKAAIQRYMWSENDGFYMDYDLDKKSYSSVKSLAGVLPLFVELADAKQVDQVSKVIENEFLQRGGLITTAIETGQQWDSPNGWAPLHWFAVQGLIKYEKQCLALTIKNRWLNTVESYFQQTGKIMEKYNVCQQSHKAEGGEYDVQEGFGWTNGVHVAFSALFLVKETKL
ncbi:alpha,alpha-trehalase TreF [Colwellia sp. BRX8-3]|nr:alpha,alpha-trehalase TreF [Colwellia sp. BRX8-9]MBA6354615.1 alpha,alpha-trehalase TreF [Colwellia sp. BRX8-3]MBA6358972.1 alpha,alpha-trehalase TreF [Colwellia sp. BRX8-6]MBA6366598.1 alpha,alpha-trehalase TreF [Colwellia sp. BRX8-5]MBA6375007.1 alpha,alpha-trehalase TreF [Colwellia sp. BRX8-2]